MQGTTKLDLALDIDDLTPAEPDTGGDPAGLAK